MFSNNGYIGSSRSVRSQEAIANYEVPMTMINKNLIKEFLYNNKILFSVDELEFLEKVSVAKWKYVSKVQVWGGSRKHPKMLGYEEVAGIVIGEWFYYLFSNGNDVGRYKINGNKVEWINKYNSYLELVNEHKNYKNKKRMFNKLIKIKVKI